MFRAQASYSTNDIPTLESTNATIVFENSDAVQNARPGYVLSAILSNGDQNGLQTTICPSRKQTKPAELSSPTSAQKSSLQASATSFGPSITSTSLESARANNRSLNGIGNRHISPPSIHTHGPGPCFGGFSMQMLSNESNQLDRTLHFSR